MKILAFETSCDETSVAVVENGKNVLSNVISSQIDIHKEFGGVVPEIASRHHIENIVPVMEEALEKADCSLSDIDYIAVTNTPGLIGSLLVGLMYAKSLSYANNIPLIPVNHITGHIFSSFIDNDVKLPAISLIISGGHTNLYYIIEENGKYNIKKLGETVDDAVGETYDKIARILGIPYPGGPIIDNLAFEGDDILKLKEPNVDGYDFSFSGIKTNITNYVNKNKMKNIKFKNEDIAASLQSVVTRTLFNKVKKCLDNMEVQSILVAGGVSANKGVREKFKEFNELGYDVVFPKMEYCTDNAAMIGCAAFYELNETNDTKEKNRTDKSFGIDAVSTKHRN